MEHVEERGQRSMIETRKRSIPKYESAEKENKIGQKNWNWSGTIMRCEIMTRSQPPKIVRFSSIFFFHFPVDRLTNGRYFILGRNTQAILFLHPSPCLSLPLNLPLTIIFFPNHTQLFYDFQLRIYSWCLRATNTTQWNPKCSLFSSSRNFVVLRFISL